MDSFLKYYDELNSRQRQAVDATEGPLLVLAGPGTGKTQLLSVRAGSILRSSKAGPENILILTYTNSAAKAMKERLARVIGPAGYDVEVCTFHGFANSVIQESEEAANYVGDKVQLSDVEETQAIAYILDNTKGLDDIRPFRAPYTYLKDIIKKIGDLKKDGIYPDDLDSYLKSKPDGYRALEDKYARRLELLAIVYRRYEEVKSGRIKGIFDERGRYDFDDMISFASEALAKEKALRGEYQELYRYAMVDEYQDTNGAQLKLLFTLFDSKEPNLCCVGDDDQSIYRFQGASVGNFRLLNARFPELMTINLKENYRSSGDLIQLSGTIIARIPAEERMSLKALEAVRKSAGEKEMLFREFTTETEELGYLVDKVREIKERIDRDPSITAQEKALSYNNIAVLVRKRADIAKVVDQFLRAGIPYATDGKEDIGSEKRVRQLLDVLDLAHIDISDTASKDLALYKVLSADYFAIPQAEILAFIGAVNELKKAAKPGTVTMLGEFLKLERSTVFSHAVSVISRLLSDVRTRSVHTILTEYIRDASVFRYILSAYSDNDILRIRDLRALSSFVNMVKAADMAKPAIRLDDFMSQMKARSDHDLPVQGNLVTLSQSGVRVYTAHGSKGLEFHSVIMPFCIHKKNWPIKPMPEKIQLPFDLFKTKERAVDPGKLKELAFYDETRLFYVASTRARSNLIFTASPTENAVSSMYLKDIDIERVSPEQGCEEAVMEKSLETTDLTDPFIGTEEVLKDMVDNLTLNPTRLNTYLDCPRKFLYNDILKLPGPKKRSLVFGNCVHKALEETFKAYIHKKKFPSFAFFRSAFRRELVYQGADDAIERECLNRLDSVGGWFAAASVKPVMPLGLERKLTVTVGDNIIFTGKYDKVEWDDEKKGLVRIVDYKTGKPDEHLKAIGQNSDLWDEECDGYLRQVACYKLLYEKDRKESKGRKVSRGVLVFIEPLGADIRKMGYSKGQYVAKSVELNDLMVKDIESIIIDVHKKITELRFAKLPAKDDDICGMCDFGQICWGA
jgi:DNA helicase-2/ATP-dependent DNA helicase PcrA